LYSFFWGVLGFVYLEVLQARLVWLVGEIREVRILGAIFLGFSVMFVGEVMVSFSKLLLGKLN